MEQKKASYLQRLSPPQHYLCCGISAALTGYGFYRYWGLYKWTAEMQLWILHGYEIKLTLLVAFLAYYIPMVFTLAAMVGPKFQSGLPRSSTQDEATASRHSWFKFLFESRSGHLLLLTIALSMVAAFQFCTAINLGDLANVDLQRLEAGTERPASRWWETKGYLLLSEAQIWKEKNTNIYYVPVVSPTWSQGKTFRLLLMVRGTAYSKLSEGMMPLRGLANAQIPGEVAEHWNSSVAPLAENTIMLAFEDGPEKRLQLAKICGIFAMVLFASFGVANSLRLRKKREE